MNEKLYKRICWDFGGTSNNNIRFQKLYSLNDLANEYNLTVDEMSEMLTRILVERAEGTHQIEAPDS